MRVYSQGDPADSVMHVQRGNVKLSVVSSAGKEAVVGVLGPGDFFGEGCLAGQTFRMGTATAMTATRILRVTKKEDASAPPRAARHVRPVHFLHSGAEHPHREDLIDQLFNSSEKRLARTLLLLARYGKEDKPRKVLPKLSQEMLAEMVGTTRSRVNFFMNKFRKLGFIDYNGGLQVNSSLLSVVLHK
jgi:CRP/FNR family transcriptional regulator, cyclic AMP receptor protein